MFNQTVREASLNHTERNNIKQMINIESDITNVMFSRTP